MMVEGTVDVTGEYREGLIHPRTRNLYQIARRAKDDNNGENAAKYYDMVLMKDHTSWGSIVLCCLFQSHGMQNCANTIRWYISGQLH